MSLARFLFSWEGRIARRHWWGAKLGILLGQAAAFVAVYLSKDPAQPTPAGVVALAWLVIAVFVWMDVVTTVKRLHDRNRSGGWFFMAFVPFIGTIWIVIECGIKAGTPGPNNFGSATGDDMALAVS